MQEVTHTGEFGLENRSVEFQADYKEYYITGVAECELSIDTEEEIDLGIGKSYMLNGVTFWHLIVKNEANEEISLNEAELNNCKNDIENYFNGLVENF